MRTSEDYYEILQVHPSAEPEVIQAAYRKLAQKYHPDVDPSPEATEKMKRLNVARDVLSDPEQRRRYDSDLLQRKGSGPSGKPKPIIDPPQIVFGNVTPGTMQRASFLIMNTGGPYSRITISNPSDTCTWLDIANWHSLSTTDELPLKVEIQAQGRDWCRDYRERVSVALDDVQTHLTVELHTRFGLRLSDHQWHDVDFDNLKDWAKKRKDELHAGKVLGGHTFRYRLDRRRGKYQVRLRSSLRSASYDPLIET